MARSSFIFLLCDVCLWPLRHSDSIINLINLLNLFNRPKGACCIEEHKCLYVKD